MPLIARELAGRGHSVRLLTYSLVESDSADRTYPFEVERIVLHRPRALRLLRTFLRIAANARKADIVYVNGLLIETALMNFFLRKPAVAKVVGDIAWERARDKKWIEDDFEIFQKKRYGWRIELRRVLRDMALRKVQAVVVPSTYLKRILSGWGIEAEKVHVIYNAFEPTPVCDAPVALPLSTSYLLITVCRLTAWKGVDGLIEAIASLPEVGLVVVGDGPERENLEAMARRLGVKERVYFAGEVPKEHVPAYLRACDLFVLNSRYEGLPHVLLEALAAGLPVVATDVGGTPEVVQDGVNGRLVPVGDVQAFREAIMKALGHHIQVTLPEMFKIERMIEGTISLLEAVARGKES